MVKGDDTQWQIIPFTSNQPCLYCTLRGLYNATCSDNAAGSQRRRLICARAYR